jgi:hypothetical protein
LRNNIYCVVGQRGDSNRRVPVRVAVGSGRLLAPDRRSASGRRWEDWTVRMARGRWRTWDSAPKASDVSPSTRTEEVGSLWCAAGRKKGRRWLPWLVDRVHGPRAPAAGRDKRGLVGLIQEGMECARRADASRGPQRWIGDGLVESAGPGRQSKLVGQDCQSVESGDNG